MRLPFPERIPIKYVFAFAALLAVAQLIEGTSTPFTFCSFLFILIAGAAFNFAGGFTQTSGAYIFFYATLVVIVGLFWKAVLGEPAQSNLSAPMTTIEAYVGSITSMFAAVYVSRKLTLKRALLGTMLEESRMLNASIGCMVAGMVMIALFAAFPHPNGSILSALQQIDRFLPMSIILGVTYQIRKSGGTSSVNLPVLIAFTFSFFWGIIGFSKEGMLTPFFCWLIAACCLRYRLSVLQVIGGILTCVFIFQFLVPYSQYGRNFRTDTLSGDIDASMNLLSNLGSVRKEFESSEADTDEEIKTFYNTPQGFFDRLQMISMDDILIAYTNQRGPFGLEPVIRDFENLVPHFIWANKPPVIGGNYYAHEVGGIVADNDTTTGISFSPTGEAFHLAGWYGIFFVAPIMWIMLFTLFDSLCGDVRKSPWGLVMTVYFAHTAPEGGVGAIIYALGYITVGIIFVAVVAAYVTPIVGTLFAGPEAIRVIRTGQRIRSIPARAPRRVSEI